MFRQANTEAEEFPIRQPKLDFDSFAGSPELISQFADIVRYLQDPAPFKKVGAKVPKGILLIGPPGVGKTLLAEVVAGQAAIGLIQISCSSLHNKYVGESEKKLRQIFDEARKNSPCVLCLDEIDSIGQQRFGAERGNEHYMNDIVNQLLTLLAEDNKEVIIFATTNNADVLDDALKRPGRFDRHIYVSLPKRAEREIILKIHTKETKLDNKVSLKDLAVLSVGFSGAKIATWVNEAAMNAVREGASAVTMDHFDDARLFIETGVGCNMNLNPTQKYRTAVHEAAHALVGHLLNQAVYKVSVLSYGKAQGYTELLPPDEDLILTHQDILNEICTAVAGRVGEQIFGFMQMGSGRIRMKKAVSLAEELVVKEHIKLTVNKDINVQELIQQQVQRAADLLNTYRECWNKLVDALVKHDELRRDNFLLILSDKEINPPEPKVSSMLHSKMPPKKAPRPITIFNDKKYPSFEISELAPQKPFPFTTAEVATALEVDLSVIRKVKEDIVSGYEIIFKPSFEDHSHMRNISKKLSQENIENHYQISGIHAYLNIYEDGISDFIAYVKKKNKNQPIGDTENKNSDDKSTQLRARL